MYVRCSSSRCYDGRRLSEQRQKFANILRFFILCCCFCLFFFVWFLVVGFFEGGGFGFFFFFFFFFFFAFMGLLSAISTTLSISMLNLQNERF